MPPQLSPSYEALSEWVRATDVHASYRVPLLARAEAVLEGRQGASGPERGRLAERLERWRYQHLNERVGRMTPPDRALADALDLAANALQGRPARPPRNPRAAIDQPNRKRPEISEAINCLDPDVPLEGLARRAERLTRDHFSRPAPRGAAGAARRRILLYAPLYVSSYCINHCTYCGFRYPHALPRTHLDLNHALGEADLLADRGLRHLLLVAGDFPRLTTTAYYVNLLEALVARGIHPAIEIAPQGTASYAELVAAGACGITLYQETYQEGLYARYHPRGTKASFDWRLEGLERAAEAGMPRLGLGILLGLADPRDDLLALMRHAAYLEARFPDRTLAFSLPRIYEAPQGFQPPCPVGDTTFIRLYIALRIAFPQAELVLSTREPADLRHRLARICITQMSAGSCTTPGGYGDASPESRSGQQFPVCDHRSPAEVAQWIAEAGLEPVWDLDPMTTTGPCF